MTKTRTCPICGVEFEPFLRRQICCCPAHQAQRRRELQKINSGRFRTLNRIRPDDLDWANARLEELLAKPVEEPATTRPGPTLKAPTSENPGYDLICEECGKVFWSREKDERYCCADCLLRAKKREAREAKGYPAKKKKCKVA